MGEPTHAAVGARLHPAVASWFGATFAAPTPAQAEAVPAVARGESVLVSSPTGSGKTLAAFLGVLSELHALADAGRLVDGIHAIYVSPLKALVHDVARNLERPLEGIGHALGGPSPVRVAVRTGETSRAARERMTREPPHILVTTPESLALVLAAPRLAEPLLSTRWLLVDELHALAGTKRGAHLALTLERLEARLVAAGRAPPARVGLSATVTPLDEAARFLTGDRPCRIIEAAPGGPVDLTVALDETEGAFLDRLDAILDASRATIVFTNARAHAERLVLAMHERFEGKYRPEETLDASVDPEFGPAADPSLVAPHHGSMSKEARLVVEERLRRGDLKCVVASSSLELGVHVEHADHVILLGSPRSAARTLQRVGRSGHRVGATSRGTLVVSHVDELAEAAALARLVRARDIEPLDVRFGGLDVLAQHLLGLALDAPYAPSDAWRLARRAWPYRDLARDDVDAVLAHLERLGLVRVRDGLVRPRGRARFAYATGSGAIPSAGLVRVVCAGRFVGEVEESFAESLATGDVFQLAGRSWRFGRSSGLSVQVEEAGSATPTVPAWRSEGISATPTVGGATRPLLDGENIGSFLSHVTFDTAETQERLMGWLALQRAASEAPGPGEIGVESVVDDDGRRAHVFHAPYGRRVTEALARGLAARLEATGEEARVVAADAGFALLTRRGLRMLPPRWRALLDAPLAPLLHDTLPRTETFRRRFRHVAQRGLLLPRGDRPLGQQQVDATRLLGALLRDDPTHPILRETWREVAHDALDLDAAEALRASIARGQTPLRALPARPFPSPYAARILLPAHGFASRDRAETLRDWEERARDWVEHAARAQAP